jgi:hypothetical protein
MQRPDIIKFLVIRSIGNFTLVDPPMVLYDFGPIIFFEAQFHIAEAKGVHYTVGQPSPVSNNKPTNGSGKGFC